MERECQFTAMCAQFTGLMVYGSNVIAIDEPVIYWMVQSIVALKTKGMQMYN